MEKRCHPITILNNLLLVIYLVIIPVLRGFFSALRGDFVAWLAGAWIDILIFIGMVSFAVLRWYYTTWRCGATGISLIIRFPYFSQCDLHWENVTALSVIEPFYLRPIGACVLRVETLGGSHRNADISICILTRHAREIAKAYRAESALREPERSYRPSKTSIVQMALLTSNSLIGILFIATVVSQSASLFGNYFSTRLLDTLEEATRALAFGIPPAAAAIGYVLLLGWLFGVILLFLRYRRFSVSRTGDYLAIQGGTPTRRGYQVKVSGIAFVDVQQTLFSAAFQLSTLFISAVGYGKHSDDIACLFPTVEQKTLQAHYDAFFPGFRPAQPQLRPEKDGKLRFLLAPVGCVGGIAALAGVALWRFPHWASFILFVAFMALAPALLFWAVRRRDFRTGGIALQDGALTMRYSAGLTFHTVVIPIEQMVGIEFYQNVFQRIAKKNCDLKIYTVAESQIEHCCRSINREQAAKLLGITL
jgi:hypothetical protein